jgi:hypothetical protein
MGCVFFARRGDESIYRLGISAFSDSKMMSLVLKDPEFKFHQAIETECPSDCEKFLQGYFASHKVGSDPTLFWLADGEIEKAVEVAESFVAKFLPLRKTAQTLSNRSTDRRYSVPTKRQMEIYQKLRRVREEEFRLQLRREYLENELKAAIGTTAGLQGIASWSSQAQKRFDSALFKSENPALYAAYQKEKTVRVFRLH